MTTVALIGGDGAGKTTIASHLEKSLPWPGKYLYMGTSVISSDAALPTSRLALAIKMHLHNKSRSASNDSQDAPSCDVLHYGPAKHGVIWVFARFLNRMAEAWWRQLLSVSYQLRGFVVIYDRHFLFQPVDRHNSTVSRIFQELELWIFQHCYPRPDLVIFLNAPPEVLNRRKADAALDQLAEQREFMIERGKMMPNFVDIDAGRPLEQVIADVSRQVIALRTRGKLKRMRRDRP